MPRNVITKKRISVQMPGQWFVEVYAEQVYRDGTDLVVMVRYHTLETDARSQQV